MENSNQEPKNKEMPKHPKPSDEVQLEIETVTPDTEKDVQPTENCSDKAKSEPSIESETTNDEEGNSSDKRVKEVDEHEEKVNNEQGTKEEKPKDTNIGETEPDENSAQNNSNDERDKIETVSP